MDSCFAALCVEGPDTVHVAGESVGRSARPACADAPSVQIDNGTGYKLKRCLVPAVGYLRNVGIIIYTCETTSCTITRAQLRHASCHIKPFRQAALCMSCMHDNEIKHRCGAERPPQQPRPSTPLSTRLCCAKSPHATASQIGPVSPCPTRQPDATPYHGDAEHGAMIQQQAALLLRKASCAQYHTHLFRIGRLQASTFQPGAVTSSMQARLTTC